MRRMILIAACLLLSACAMNDSGTIVSRWPDNQPFPKVHLSQAELKRYADINEQIKKYEKADFQRRARLQLYNAAINNAMDYDYFAGGFYHPWFGFGWNPGFSWRSGAFLSW